MYVDHLQGSVSDLTTDFQYIHILPLSPFAVLKMEAKRRKKSFLFKFFFFLTMIFSWIHTFLKNQTFVIESKR